MIQKLIDKIQKTSAPIVVGLDPTMKMIPSGIKQKAFEEYGETLEGAAEAIWQFNKAIVDATYDLIPAVKPQIAMYEQFGIPGLVAFKKNDMSHTYYGNDKGSTIPMSTGFDQWCWGQNVFYAGFGFTNWINDIISDLVLTDEGKVDFVIGTHKLLNDEIKYKNLGLLIIDEEHRFGVKAKEKIKQYKTNIDVLTMTATPIPRTLHMSIVGMRDMSVIYEPPQDRKPVQTYVLEYDEEVIREAITKELERNGQVYYLYNNVEGIVSKVNQIEKLVPEAKVGFAHGKMTGNEIEEIMEQFVEQKINVLVCTTILESGIDIPNANTIIVENADKLGLAQLYQIRGRVGRSNKQAYSFITYRRDKLLSEVADKRLKAIKEFTEFGSGFKIAMRDLEIRGAGSVMGEFQHGHMENVGYDMYCKLLDQVVKELKGEEIVEESDIQIDLNISSYIPDEFIQESSQKIEIYQNIALCKTDKDIEDVVDEIIDRYGQFPKEIGNLLEIAKIKNIARDKSVIKLTQKGNNIVYHFNSNKFNFNIVDKLIKIYRSRIKFSAGNLPYITFQLSEKYGIIEQCKEFLNNL